MTPRRESLPAQVHAVTVGLAFVYAETDDILRRAMRLLTTPRRDTKEWKKERREVQRLFKQLGDVYEFDVQRPRVGITKGTRRAP